VVSSKTPTPAGGARPGRALVLLGEAHVWVAVDIDALRLRGEQPVLCLMQARERMPLEVHPDRNRERARLGAGVWKRPQRPPPSALRWIAARARRRWRTWRSQHRLSEQGPPISPGWRQAGGYLTSPQSWARSVDGDIQACWPYIQAQPSRSAESYAEYQPSQSLSPRASEGHHPRRHMRFGMERKAQTQSASYRSRPAALAVMTHYS
jgi:hypothetical protein